MSEFTSKDLLRIKRVLQMMEISYILIMIITTLALILKEPL